MNDLIKRSDAIDELMHIIPYKCYYNGEYTLLLNKRECLAAIKAVPTADRLQGEWETIGKNHPYKRCPFCKRTRAFTDTRFCDWCGARMKGTDDE